MVVLCKKVTHKVFGQWTAGTRGNVKSHIRSILTRVLWQDKQKHTKRFSSKSCSFSVHFIVCVYHLTQVRLSREKVCFATNSILNQIELFPEPQLLSYIIQISPFTLLQHFDCFLLFYSDRLYKSIL